MGFEAYGQAVIHLAWYRDDKIYCLVFGMVELCPSELPRAVGCSLKSSRFGVSLRRRPPVAFLRDRGGCAFGGGRAVGAH